MQMKPNGRKAGKDYGTLPIYGNLAGATDIIFHPGSYFTLPPEEVLKVAIPRLQDLVSRIRNQGILVTFRTGNHGKTGDAWIHDGYIGVWARLSRGLFLALTLPIYTPGLGTGSQ